MPNVMFIFGGRLPSFTLSIYLPLLISQPQRSMCPVSNGHQRRKSSHPLWNYSHANCSRPFNTIGLPYYRDTLASAWPDIPCDVGAPPVKFDAQFLSGLKATEFGLYGRNTRGLRRNQAEDTRNVNKAGSSGLKAPKFLSEKARELATSQAVSSDDKADELTSPFTELEIESKKSEVPVMYRNVEIKYSKFGVDDFDFGLVSPQAMAAHGFD